MNASRSVVVFNPTGVLISLKDCLGPPTSPRRSALLQIGISLAALGLVLGHLALYGVIHNAEEGNPAHLFQLMLELNVPIAARSSWKRRPKQALTAAGMLLQVAMIGFPILSTTRFTSSGIGRIAIP